MYNVHYISRSNRTFVQEVIRLFCAHINHEIIMWNIYVFLSGNYYLNIVYYFVII